MSLIEQEQQPYAYSQEQPHRWVPPHAEPTTGQSPKGEHTIVWPTLLEEHLGTHRDFGP